MRISSLHEILLSPATSYLLGPNIFPSTLFSETPILSFSFIVTAKFHTHIKPHRIYIYTNTHIHTLLYFTFFVSLCFRIEDKDKTYRTEFYQTFPEFKVSLISSQPSSSAYIQILIPVLAFSAATNPAYKLSNFECNLD